jgi:hypothetical protein
VLSEREAAYIAHSSAKQCDEGVVPELGLQVSLRASRELVVTADVHRAVPTAPATCSRWPTNGAQAGLDAPMYRATHSRHSALVSA